MNFGAVMCLVLVVFALGLVAAFGLNYAMTVLFRYTLEYEHIGVGLLLFGIPVWLIFEIGLMLRGWS
ncbi:hypothetical protein [Sutterella sp.]|uniref:hypothetical protein n=1 Tax=Sutterella sp. TaxID=1981025 RepID=UPI0026DEAE6F|nr:hypothetical protein [Sutterella sp.]MDO5531045.1 hypothetical protein [Sutterella sp.]